MSMTDRGDGVELVIHPEGTVLDITQAPPGIIPVSGTWAIERTLTKCDSITARDPDPRWVFIDQCGHEHRWVRDTKALGDHFNLPTLDWVVTGTVGYDDGCGMVDFVEEGEYRCRDCGQVVEPGTVEPPPGKMVAGPMTWSAEIVLTKAQAEAVPRNVFTAPVAVRTPAGCGKAWVMEMTPQGPVGNTFKVRLRGIGELSWDKEQQGEQA